MDKKILKFMLSSSSVRVSFLELLHCFSEPPYCRPSYFLFISNIFLQMLRQFWQRKWRTAAAETRSSNITKIPSTGNQWGKSLASLQYRSEVGRSDPSVFLIRFYQATAPGFILAQNTTLPVAQDQLFLFTVTLKRMVCTQNFYTRTGPVHKGH